MKKQRIVQYALLLSALAATVLLFDVPLKADPVLGTILYCLLALLPQCAAILLRVHIIREQYAELKELLKDDKAPRRNAFTKKKVYPFIPAFNGITREKSDGINPNCAAPCLRAAA